MQNNNTQNKSELKLKKDSIKWAVQHLDKYNDTDLFPKLFELNIIKENENIVIDYISNIDISSHCPNSARRFIVPKDNVSYRVATQLDPLDSIILASLIYEYGNGIEERRLSCDEKKVFSYRFFPDSEGMLYRTDVSWHQFWEQCKLNTNKHEYAIILDISDFYNQIYHHTLENQLIESGFKNQAIKWIIRLIESLTIKVSRGIPVGPHSAHLLAEAALIPIDNSLKYRGINFCRYVDDIIVFCNSEEEAKIILYTFAEILDRQQKLVLQRHKTKILKKEDMLIHINSILAEKSVNETERNLIDYIQEESEGDPYFQIRLLDNNTFQEELFSEENINLIINDYLDKEEINYNSFKWFLRRLSQVGTPNAVKIILSNIMNLMPALNDICRYFVSITSNVSDWKEYGEILLGLLDNPLIKSNNYFQLSIMSLFNRQVSLNHFSSLLKDYKNKSNLLRREIIITAFHLKAADWIRELKEDFPSMDIWTKRAYIISSSLLPKDEKKFFLRTIAENDDLTKLLKNLVKDN